MAMSNVMRVLYVWILIFMKVLFIICNQHILNKIKKNNTTSKVHFINSESFNAEQYSIIVKRTSHFMNIIHTMYNPVDQHCLILTSF